MPHCLIDRINFQFTSQIKMKYNVKQFQISNSCLINHILNVEIGGNFIQKGRNMTPASSYTCLILKLFDLLTIPKGRIEDREREKKFTKYFMFVLIFKNAPLTAISSEKNQFLDTHLSHNLWQS